MRSELGIPLPGCTGWGAPLPYQREILRSRRRVIVCQWGRGCGKTTVLWLRAMIDALLYPGMRTLVIAPAYRVLTDGLYPVIMDVDATYREVYGSSLIQKWSRSPAINTMRLVGGSTFVFRSTGNIDLLRGGSYGSVLIEEAGYIDASPGSWAAFMPAVRGYGPHRIMAGGTPQGASGVLGVLLELARRQPDDVLISRAATIDNPFYPPEQLELLRATLSPDMWRQEVLGEVVTPSGLVYPEFDPAKNIIDFPLRRLAQEPGWEIYEVVDWGYAQAHRLTLAVRQEDDSHPPIVVVLRDIPYDRKDAAGIVRDIITSMNAYPIQMRALIADGRGMVENRVARSMLAQYGRGVIYERDLSRTRVDKTIELVRRAVLNAAGERTLLISREVAANDANKPGGRGIVQAFAHYRLSEAGRGTGVFTSRPLDDNKYAHAMDAIRYWYVNMHKFGYTWPIPVKDVLAESASPRYAQ